VLIDWFTVIAQIINFLILVALLKYFLYDRITRAMEEREAKIRARLTDAEGKSQDAEEKAQQYHQKLEDLEATRKEKLSEIKEEAEKKRKELLQNARRDSEALHKRWQESLRREEDAFMQELRRTTARQIYAVVRRAMKDLADRDLQQKVVDTFVRRLQELEKDQRKELKKALQEDESDMIITSSFDLPSRTRSKLTRVLHEQIGKDAGVTYETSSDISLGIQLKVPGKKLGWSLETYLEKLEQEVLSLLHQKSLEGKS